MSPNRENPSVPQDQPSTTFRSSRKTRAGQGEFIGNDALISEPSSRRYLTCHDAVPQTGAQCLGVPDPVTAGHAGSRGRWAWSPDHHLIQSTYRCLSAVACVWPKPLRRMVFRPKERLGKVTVKVMDWRARRLRAPWPRVSVPCGGLLNGHGCGHVAPDPVCLIGQHSRSFVSLCPHRGAACNLGVHGRTGRRWSTSKPATGPKPPRGRVPRRRMPASPPAPRRWSRGAARRWSLPCSALQGTGPQRPTIQRWTNPVITLKSRDELIQDGAGGDINAINQLSAGDYGHATEPQRLAMIGHINARGNDRWGRDTTSLCQLWDSRGRCSGRRWTGIARRCSPACTLAADTPIRRRMRRLPELLRRNRSRCR